MKFTLPYIIFEATQQCNLKCRYCYNPWRRSDEEPPATPFKTAARTLKKIFASIDFSHITFTGGEPFLADGIKELVLSCRMKGKHVTVITNGTTASEKEYRLLHKMGVALFELPLLSASSEIHDRLTGVPGTFDKVLQSISQLKAIHAKVCTVFVMTKQNISQLEPTLALAEQLDISHFMLARFNIGGRGIRYQEQLLPSLSELRTAFSFANDFTQHHSIRISANVCLPRCIIDQDNYPNIPISTCSSHFNRRPVTIDFNGDVRMCNHSPHTMGNIHNQPIESLFTSGYAEQWQTGRPDFCSTCTLWERCRGGCRAASEQVGKTLAYEDPVIQIYHPTKYA